MTRPYAINWIDAVRRLDETPTSENKHHQELIEETFNKRQAKRQNTDNNALGNTSRCYNTSNSNASTSTASTSTSTFTPLPLLLDSERMLLNEHDGCTKCRKFYVGHRSRDCPTGFPPGKGYKTLTIVDALTAKRGKSTTTTSSSASSSKQPSKAVAATAPSSDDEPNVIAAVLPSASDYTSDSEENADIAERDVSPPIKSKHLVWDCQIHGVLTDFPVKTRALIDNGAHVVLIHPDIVAKLNLRKHRLHEPEIIDVTMNNGKKSSLELYEYVKLSLTSLDATWTSKTVKAHRPEPLHACHSWTPFSYA